MGMFDIFETVGSKLFKAGGEGDETIQSPDTDHVDFGESKSTHNRADFINGLFDVQQLTSLLPYATFDAETDLFYNQDSIGFVLETEALVGASTEIQTQIQNKTNLKNYQNL